MFGEPLSRRNDYGSGGIEEQLEEMRSGKQPEPIERKPGALANPRPMSNPMFAAYLVKLAGLLLDNPAGYVSEEENSTTAGRNANMSSAKCNMPLANEILKIAKNLIAEEPKLYAISFGDIRKKHPEMEADRKLMSLLYHYSDVSENTFMAKGPEKDGIVELEPFDVEKQKGMPEVVKVPKDLLLPLKHPEHAKFKKGDVVWIGGNKRTTYKIIRVKPYAEVFTYKVENLRNGAVMSSGIDEDDLTLVGSKIVDKYGRNPVESAEFTYPKGSKVIIDFHRTTMETVGTVEAIGPAGEIIVQTHGTDFSKGRNMEEGMPDFKENHEKMKFRKPHLWHGEWVWDNGESQFIKGPYKGGKTTHLLD